MRDWLEEQYKKEAVDIKKKTKLKAVRFNNARGKGEGRRKQ